MKFDLITRNKNQTEKEKHKIRREQSALREQSAIPQGQMRSVETVMMMMMMVWWRCSVMNLRKTQKRKKIKVRKHGSVSGRHQAKERKGKDKGKKMRFSTDCGLLKWSWSDDVGWSFKNTRPRWLMVSVDWFADESVEEWWVKGSGMIDKVDESWFYFTPVDFPQYLMQNNV